MKRTLAMPSAKRALQLLTPPMVWWLAHRLRRRQSLDGPFDSWDAAAKRATGWDSPAIGEQALAAALKVRDGTAAFERDSKPYDRIIYSPAILAALLLAVARYRALNVIDFGGALGSNYFQNIKLLRQLPGMPISWNVVERAPLAAVGAAQFQTAELRFHAEIATVSRERAVLLFTGSLQYVADVFGFLTEAVRGVEIVALDNVLIHTNSEHAIYLQRLDARRFGEVTLPTWGFARDALVGWFAAHGLALVEEFRPNSRARFQNWGMLFVRSRGAEIGQPA